MKLNDLISSGFNRRMKLNDLIFSGFNRRVAALDRNTGRIVWQWKSPKTGGYNLVTLLLEQGLLIVAVGGYHYALDPLTGKQIWANEMEGMGTGATCLISFAQPNGQTPNHAAAVHQAAATYAASAAS